ncbi:MAG: MATE family efflux transporter [Bacteroidales bacterium]|nr:MATE family efflux transporter [Bacteroidales bacterium]
MQHSEKKGLDYANGGITKLFRKIFFPTLLGMVFTALITIVDGIFVGKGVGPDGIAAVNIIAPLYMVSTGIGLMLGIGASVTAGIAMAENDNRKASRIISQAFMTGTFLMTGIILVVLFFPVFVAESLGSSQHLLSFALDYLCWLIPGTVFLAWSSIGMMVIRLDGSPKYAMLINVIPAVLNIVGDYILIFPCGMGVKGAAIATAGSIAIGGCMSLIYFRFSYVLKLVADLKDYYTNLRKVIAIGSSAFVTEIAMSVMMLTGNFIFMRYFGDAGVAAYSIACYLFPLMFMMSNSVAQSAQPIISYNYGIKSADRVEAAFGLSKKVALLCGMLVTIIIFLFSGRIISLFIPLSTEAGEIALHGLPIYSFCAIFFSLNIAYIGYYQSIGKAMRAMVFTLLRGVVFLVPLFFILPAVFPEWGMWSAIPSSELLTYLVILLMVRKRR